MDRIANILHFWFGKDEGVTLPSAALTNLWFIATEESNQLIKLLFEKDVDKAINNDYKKWENDPKGALALILLLDQFSRRIYANSAKAYTQDSKALRICVQGIANGIDENLSLLERIFFYFPLMHSENFKYQQQAINYIDGVNQIALSETRDLFNVFSKYALQHYEIIKVFHRFPDRNKILNRESTAEELELLKFSDFKS